MARYWVGGSGTWTGTTNWSASAALTFTASCSGTTLTTTGSPALLVGMTVWATDNSSLGTITGGSGNTWTVSFGGTRASQGMTAATTGATAPTNIDDVFFTATSSLVSYGVASAASSQNCKTLTMSGPATGTLTFSGTNNVNLTGSNAALTILTPSTVSWTNTGIIQATGTGTLTLDTRGCSLASSITINGPTTISLSSNFIITGTLTFNSGTFTINSYTLSVNILAMGNGLTRTFNFATGNVYVTGPTYSTSSEAGLTFAGTPVINMTYTGASTITIGTGTAPTVAQCPSFNISCNGGAALTLPLFADNINMTGFVGSLAATNIVTVYGDLTFSANSTMASTTNSIVMAAQSGSQTLVTNGISFNRPININCASVATCILGDPVNMSNVTNRSFTLTSGTLDLNSNTLTGFSFVTAAGTKVLKFNGGYIYLFGTGATVFNNAAPTNFSSTAGANGPGFIYMTASTAKTFVGGSSTFAATLVQAGSGTLTVTGSNSFGGGLKNVVQPCTISFTSSTTNTFTGDIKLKGTGPSPVTLNAVTVGTKATLSHTGSTVACDYVSVTDHFAAGTVPFYAGAHSSINNTTNWSLSPPPSANTEFMPFLR